MRLRKTRPKRRPDRAGGLPWLRYAIAEESMTPSLRPGDFVVVSRRGPIRRGSIVVYDAEALTHVKRVIGLPGETVAIDAGVVMVDGAPEPSPVWEAATRPDGRWEVGQDEIFVLGDHRQRSAADSRQAGPVALDTVIGVVRLRYWPSLRRFSAPPTPPSGDGARRRSA